MKPLLAFLYLLCLLPSAIVAQEYNASLPQCALSCTITPFPACNGPTNQTCICTSSAAQQDFTFCVFKSCTIKESLMTRNVTANTCSWPRRDRSLLLRNASLPLFAIATISLMARITARMPLSRRQLGLDDLVIVVAWMLLFVLTVFIWIMSVTGLGRDVWTIPFDNIFSIMRNFAIFTQIYISVSWLTKISILLFYLRLFPDRTFRLLAKIGLVFCSLTGFSFFWACLLQCSPISFAWTFWDGEHRGKCANWAAQGWANVFINIFADIAVLLLPLPTIWKLNLPLEKRLSVIAMFGVGLFVTLVSIYRATRLPAITNSTNLTWDLCDPGLWSVIEMYVGVICACMPGIRAFVTQVLKIRDSKKLKESQASTDSSHPTDSTKSIGSGGGFLKKFENKNEYELTTRETEAESTPRLASIELRQIERE